MNWDIRPHVIQSMRVVCSFNTNYEWAAELWGTTEGDTVKITDFLLLKQIVSRYSVNQSLSTKQRTQFQRDTRYYHMLRNKLGKGKKLIGWVHSHNTMEAFLSKVDRDQIKNYFQHDNNLEFIFSFVISVKKFITGKTSIVNRVLNRVNRDLPIIEIKIWLDGIFENKTYFNHEIYFPKSRFKSHKVMNSYVPRSLINELREEYDDLVEISCVKNKKPAVVVDESRTNDDSQPIGFEIFD